MTHQKHRMPFVARAPRRGFSLLEFEIAMLVLGIAISGLFPLVVMYSRGLESLESRCPTVGDWYLAPSSDPWARKLGAGALLTDVDPGPQPAEPVLAVDDGDAGYAETGDWTTETGAEAFQEDRRRHLPPPESTPPSESDFVEWTFSDVAAGWYQILATWTAAEGQANDARFALYEGETSLDDVYADQTVAPAGPVYEETSWHILATEYIRADAVRVRLYGEAAGGDVIADAVRLVPIENNVQVLALQKSLAGEEATARVSVEVLVPE